MSITINKCAKCGHEWPQSGAKPPRRCPASGCRTVKWSPAGSFTVATTEDQSGFYESIESECRKRGKSAQKRIEKMANDLLRRRK